MTSKGTAEKSHFVAGLPQLRGTWREDRLSFFVWNIDEIDAISHQCLVWYNIVAAWDEDSQNKFFEDESSSYEKSMFAWNHLLQFTNCYEYLDDYKSLFHADFNKLSPFIEHATTAS